MGVGLLEFHQLDRMIQSGRAAARALLEQASGDLGRVGDLPAGLDTGPALAAAAGAEPLLTAQSSNGHPSTMPGGRPGSM